MNDNTVEVRLVADSSGVAPAFQKAKGEVLGLDESIAGLNASMQALSAQMSASMAKATGVAKEAHAAAVSAKHGAEEAGVGFEAMGHKIHEAAESVRTMQMRAKEFAELYVGLFAGEKVLEFARGMAEAAEQTKHTGEQFGMTTAEVQQLNGMAKQTGISADALTKSFGIMDRGLVNSKGSTSAQANAFKQMGISIDDGRTQMEKFAVVSDKFKDMADGPKKAALAMLIFGRSGKELIPILNEGSAGIDEFNKRTGEYGGVNEAATAAGGLLAESINTSALAMTGLKNTLTEAFAPVLTEMVDGFNLMVKSMIDSYNAGGVVKTAFDVVAAAASGVVEVVTFTKNAFMELFSGSGAAGLDWKGLMIGVIDVVVIAVKGCIAIVVGLASAFKIGFEAIMGYAQLWYANLKRNLQEASMDLDVLKIAFQTFGRVATDALTLHWGSIAADWDAGMAQIQGVVHNRGAAIVAEARNATNAAKDILIGANADGAALREWWKHIDDKGQKAEGTGVKAPKMASFDPEMGATHKGKKDKKPKTEKGPSELDQWKSDLADKLLLEQNWGVDEQAFSKAFWAEKIKTVKAGSKEWLEIHRIMQAEEKALGKEAQAEALAKIKEQIAAEIDAAKTSAEVAKLSIEAKIQAADEELKSGRINAVQLAQIKRKLNGDLLALDVDLINKQYTLTRAGLEAELVVERGRTKEQAKINNDIELLDARHQTALTVVAAKGNLARAKDDNAVLAAQRARFATMAKAFGDAIGQMVTFQKGFVATINGLWQSLMGGISQAISRMVTHWVTAIATGTIAEERAHIRLVAMHAKSAAAAAWKAVVGIPVVGPFLAPVAAAAAFAGVMAFSAEGGMDRVPYDGATIIAHKDEMVLSAQYANPLRDMLSGGKFGLPSGMSSSFRGAAANSNAPAAANEASGGDTHNHYHYEANFHGPASKSEVAAWFKEHGVGVAAAADHGIRSGYIPRHM